MSITIALVMLAQAAPAVADDADAIVITAQRSPSRVQPPTDELGGERLVERQARTAAEAIDALPGVAVRTNSRGETIARVRGSEERQTVVFLDGTPLAVPWDGRVDLGILPAGLIGRVAVTKGAVPIEYGTNAVAGAVDLRSVGGAAGDAARVTAAGSIGTLGFADGSAVALLPAGQVRLTLAAGFLTRDAERVAKRSALPFSQPDSDRRLNTDLDSASLFGSASWSRGPLSLRGFVLHAKAERGIAPESDRNPAVDAPRYWRYPDVEQTQAGLTGRVELGRRSSAQLTLWRQWFGQTIEQFTNQSYTTLRATEVDEDDTLGGRLVVNSALGPVGLRLVASAQTSRHAQVDEVAPFTAAAPELVYRQELLTIGGEADIPLGPGKATLGLAYDHVANPKTGDKDGQPATGAAAFSAAWRAPLGGGWELGLSGGRRNRFPSLREAFGEALGRFLPNPDLQPEQAWLADAELVFRSDRVAVTINPFVNRMDGTIAQRMVTVGGRRLRQRFNLSGSWSYGLDLAARAILSDLFAVELAGTLLRSRADRGELPFRDLVQRPWLDLEAALILTPSERWSLRAEVQHVGRAYDLAPDGSRARLAAGTELNLRARWAAMKIGPGHRLWLTGSVDNLTDALITPQLGLPLAGRSVRVGFRVE